MAGEAERRGREAGDGVEGEADHLRQRIFALAGMALGTVVDDRYLAEADPGDHAADEACLLGQAQQRIERAPAHQAEVARVERDLDLGEAGERAVEELRGAALERGL